ncbi:low molecular weight phosphotyrosine protein phosphatase [Flavobacteriales bacterium]|nr:low molecular weight phosphotyrosine protein phosphatase [Flavobacteriales bacterium]
MATPRVLMVCLGNICRSPMAEGILKYKAQSQGLSVLVDSAGTSDWHSGEQPDGRAMEEMRNNGIDISNQASRPFSVLDFTKFDYILVMDDSNRNNVLSVARNQTDISKVHMILDFGNEIQGRPVPDPYYDDGFGRVYDLLDYACEAFIEAELK